MFLNIYQENITCDQLNYFYKFLFVVVVVVVVIATVYEIQSNEDDIPNFKAVAMPRITTTG